MAQEKAAEIINLNVSRDIRAGNEDAGQVLAAARQAAGQNLTTVSDATKIKIEHLEAIEASDAAALPATPYAVGFVKAYAEYLGLPADDIVERFKADIGAAVSVCEMARVERQVMEAEGTSDGVRLVSFIAIGLILVFFLWVGFQVVSGPRDNEVQGPAVPERRVVLAAEEAVQPPRPRLIAVETNPPDTVDETVSVDAQPFEEMVSGEPSSPAIATEDEAIMEIAETLLSENVVIVSPEIDAEDVIPASADLEPQRIIPPAPTIIEARLIRSKAPRYPSRCERRASELEQVTVLFDVTADGRTANARPLLSTNDCFNAAALQAVEKWRFTPRTVDDAVQASIGQRATLNFQQ